MRLAAAIIVALLSTPAQALYVDPNGNDENDCSSPSKACATFNRAISLVRFGTVENIFAAPGTYRISEPINVFYWRGIAIRGPMNGANCAEPRATIEATSDNITAFWAQDISLLVVSCLSIVAAPDVKSLIAFGVRQSAILDFGPGIRFGKMAQYMSVTDKGMASCIGTIYLDGNAQVMFGASKGSILNLHCPMVMVPDLEFLDFVQSLNSGTNVDVSSATFSTDGVTFSRNGAQGDIRGRPYTVDNGELTLHCVTLPGEAPPQLINNAVVRSRCD